MTQQQTPRETIEEVLRETAVVQLAAFKAAIDFWDEWVKHASTFNEETLQRLLKIEADPSKASQLLAEVADLSRGALRAMNELPRHAANRFTRALDEYEALYKRSPKTASRPRAQRAARAKP